MGQRGLFARLYTYCILISLICLSVILFFASASYKNYSHGRTRQHLASYIKLIEAPVGEAMQTNDIIRLQTVADDFTKSTNAPLDILDSAGRILYSTRSKSLGDISTNIEVLHALGGEPGEAVVSNKASGRDSLILTRPVFTEGQVSAILRSESVLVSQMEIIAQGLGGVVVTGVILFIALALFSWRVVRKVSVPLHLMREQAEQIAKGNFAARADFEPSDFIEVQRLSVAMNETAVELGERIQTVLTQKNEMDAVFSSMTEGVIAIDPDERILHLNQAAANILDISRSDAAGRALQEVIRIPEIQEFIHGSHSRDESYEQDVELKGQSEQILQLRSSPLRNAENFRIGTVLVINDITRLRRLESHRRDFVANVSHELRTPLTSIQGFAETLMNPNVTDPKEVRKFIEVIHRHAARLGAIIEDLLALSRIERDSEDNTIELTMGPLRPSLAAAVELCEVKAKERNVNLQIDCAAEISAKINPPLLEQAIVNLVDNAIKYSDPGSNVKISAQREAREVVISVKDHGPGIPKQHLPRLFERFYRVDKARSRKLGGTGLGLSIVKHVSLAHRGRLEVESELGQGSKFSIHLPFNA